MRMPAKIHRESLGSSRRFVSGLLMLFGVLLPSACEAPEADRITCDDIPAFEDVSYSTLEVDLSDSCAISDCHGNEVAQNGIRFDSPSAIRETLEHRGASVYGALATGEMPRLAEDSDVPDPDGRWGQSSLRNFRGWYCYGEYFDE